MSGGLGKLLGKATDMLGLTDNEGLEQQQRMAEQQAEAAKQQAALEANSAADNIAEVNPSGAASASADAITSEQKKRRRAGQSNPLGL
ncbi:virion structural protein [Klebsiella phage KPV811]|uniref:Uncharacterized protein n=1 Tax=Klebsiella phage KPV811 TaxID=1913574 RepID=A0A1J0MHM1_9CAUD|nr:virion structural protein [Klebsiella phage KPV811]APD20675.1 hypothetical protein [Klebsiella phage KPV811]